MRRVVTTYGALARKRLKHTPRYAKGRYDVRYSCAKTTKKEQCIVKPYRFLIGVLILTACAIISWYAIFNFSAPYVFLFFCSFLGLIYFAFVSQNKIIKLICLNVGAFMISLALFEGYLWLDNYLADRPQEGKIYPKGYIIDNDILGYAPRKNNTITATKRHKGELVYEAGYTIDEHGLRLSPPYKENARECILFFGGSFTFGEGVNDEESMPYQVGIKSEGEYRIYNFGFHGYGPHQMLAAIEQGVLEEMVDCEAKYMIYQAILGHISRSAGLSSWDQYGPKYVLREGEVHWAGNFSSHLALAFIKRTANKSLIYRNLRRNTPNANDIDLFVGIVRRSRDLLAAKYPNSEFHVLLWGNHSDKLYPTTLQKLTDKGLNVHKVTQIVPNDAQSRSKYQLHRYDGHPNARAHEMMAEYVLSHIIDQRYNKKQSRLFSAHPVKAGQSDHWP